MCSTITHMILHLVPRPHFLRSSKAVKLFLPKPKMRLLVTLLSATSLAFAKPAIETKDGDVTIVFVLAN
jgi:hypothetical protein